MSQNLKDMYTSAYLNKNSARNLLTQQYMSVMDKINSAYDLLEKNIHSEYDGYKNSAAAQNKITKNNISDQLLQKGLSKSGESVQASLMADMSLANTLTELDKSRSDKISSNNSARMKDISSLQKEYISQQNMLDSELRDLEYQRERDTAEDSRWEKEFEYKKSRDAESDRQWNATQSYKKSQDAVENDLKKQQLARDIYENDRDYKLEKSKAEAQQENDKQKYNLEKEKLEQEKINKANENYIKNQYLALEKEARNSSSEKDSREQSGKITYNINEDGYFEPNMSANYLIELIQRESSFGCWSNSTYVTPKKLAQKRILDVLSDKDLDPEYARELEFYAKVRGILD